MADATGDVYAELAYMCPHTTTYVSSYSSYYYISICSVSGVPDAELAFVSSYYSICVLVLLILLYIYLQRVWCA